MVCPLLSFANSPKISIVWSTENYSSDEYILKDAVGNPLSAGVQGNGDGDLVELGYYSLATSGSPFAGDWIALTQNTHVGDSSTGYGFEDGKFAFTSTFTRDSDTVTIFPTEPKVFVETLDFTISSTSPPPGIPICIRFYDSPTKTENTRYNAVTGTNWKWPSFPNGSSIPSNSYWKIAAGTPPSGSYWNYGSTFQDSSNPYQATLYEQFDLGVSVASDSAGRGTVTDINGSYNSGSYQSITASASEHYMFYQWQGGTFTESWNHQTEVLVDRDLNIEAVFLPRIYNISVPEHLADLVEGWGPHDYGTTISLETEIPNGYEFSHWEEDEEPAKFGNPADFAVTGNRMITPIFTAVERGISITVPDGGQYTIYEKNGSVATSLYHDQNYTIILTPAPYFAFTEWSANSGSLLMLEKDEQSLLEQYKLSVTGDAEFVANFELIQNYLFVNAGAGAQSVSPNSNMFTADISDLAVSATAMEGFRFDYWSDPQGILADPNQQSTEANMSKVDVSAEITANFKIIDYNQSSIEITPTLGGSTLLTGDDSGKLSHFGQYTIRAIPEEGYQFDYWAGEGNLTNLVDGALVADNSLIVEGPISLQAVFSPSSYTLALDTDPSYGGTVSGGGGFTLLDSLSISADPFPYWEFVQWDGDTQYLVSPYSAESLIQFPNLGELRDINLTAQFRRQSFSFSGNSEENGKLLYSVERDGRSIHSNTTFFSVRGGTTESPFYQFTNSFGEVPDFDSIKLYRGSTYTFKSMDVSTSHPFMIGESNGDLISELVQGGPLSEDDGNITLTIPSDFEGKLFYFCSDHSSMVYEFAIDDPPSTFSTVEGISENTHLSFLSEDKITIEGFPDTGWKFNRWVGLPREEATMDWVSLDPYLEIAQFSPIDDVNVTAKFTRQEYDVIIEDPGLGGVSSESGTYLYEDQVSLSAIPQPHFYFNGWSGSGTNYLNFPPESGNNSFSMPAQNITLKPNFEPNLYQIDTEADENGSISHFSTWADQNHTGFEINGTSFLRVISTPNDGYVLKSLEWNNSKGLSGVSYSTEYTIPSLDANYSFRASFKIPPSDTNYNLVNTSPEKGDVEDNSESATHDSRTFLATSLTNNSFLGWTFSGDVNPSPHWTSHEIELSVVDDLNIRAHFASNPKHTLYDFNASRGTVTKATLASTIQLNATASNNYKFSHWENLKSYSYTVSRNFSSILDSHSRLFINGLESPELTLVKGYTYHFLCDLDDENFFISSTRDGNIANKITSGITDTQDTDSILSFTVPEDCPDIVYYHGTSSSNSGNLVKVVSLDDEEIIPLPNQTKIHFPENVDLSVFAHFEPVELELSTNVSGNGNIELVEVDTYFYGDLVHLKAIADDHWAFSHWEGNLEILTPAIPEINISLLANSEISAVFERKKYSLEISTSPSSFGNAFTKSNKYQFKYGETVDIEAIAKTGKVFTGWTGGDVTDEYAAQTNIQIVGHSTLTANFAANAYNITKSFLVLDKDNHVLQHEEPGQINGDDNALDEDIASFSIDLVDGFEFLYWRDGDSNISLSSDPSISKKITADFHLQAVIRKSSYQIRVTSYPSNTGSVLFGNDSYSNYFEFTAYHGDTINFSTSPNQGFKFKNWMSSSGSLAFPTSQSISFSVDQDLQLAAYFGPQTDLVLNIMVEPVEAGWTVGAGTYKLNSALPILAIPKDGWLFNQWIGVDINQTTSSTTTVNLDQSKTIIAQFVVDPNYEPTDPGNSTPDPSLNVLIVSPDEPLSGSTTGSGLYDTGWVEITATPSSNYLFSYWEGVGVEDSLSPMTRVYVEKDREITAHFEYVSNADHALFVSANNDTFGQVTGTGTYRDTWANINAIANTGYTFVGWEGEDIIDLFSAQTQIFVNTTKEAIAHFQPISVFAGSTDVGNGWWDSPWFGVYWKPSSSQWTFHAKLGWVHIRNVSDDSVWIWIDRMNGWFWTAKPHYPYLYNARTNSTSWYWLNLQKSSPSEILIYKYGESAGWLRY